MNTAPKRRNRPGPNQRARLRALAAQATTAANDSDPVSVASSASASTAVLLPLDSKPSRALPPVPTVQVNPILADGSVKPLPVVPGPIALPSPTTPTVPTDGAVSASTVLPVEPKVYTSLFVDDGETSDPDDALTSWADIMDSDPNTTHMSRAQRVSFDKSMAVFMKRCSGRAPSVPSVWSTLSVSIDIQAVRAERDAMRSSSSGLDDLDDYDDEADRLMTARIEYEEFRSGIDEKCSNPYDVATLARLRRALEKLDPTLVFDRFGVVSSGSSSGGAGGSGFSVYSSISGCQTSSALSYLRGLCEEWDLGARGQPFVVRCLGAIKVILACRAISVPSVGHGAVASGWARMVNDETFMLPGSGYTSRQQYYKGRPLPRQKNPDVRPADLRFIRVDMESSDNRGEGAGTTREPRTRYGAQYLPVLGRRNNLTLKTPPTRFGSNVHKYYLKGAQLSTDDRVWWGLISFLTDQAPRHRTPLMPFFRYLATYHLTGNDSDGVPYVNAPPSVADASIQRPALYVLFSCGRDRKDWENDFNATVSEFFQVG
jgi:hypothetical protein